MSRFKSPSKLAVRIFLETRQQIYSVMRAFVGKEKLSLNADRLLLPLLSGRANTNRSSVSVMTMVDEPGWSDKLCTRSHPVRTERQVQHSHRF